MSRTNSFARALPVTRSHGDSSRPRHSSAKSRNGSNDARGPRTRPCERTARRRPEGGTRSRSAVRALEVQRRGELRTASAPATRNATLPNGCSRVFDASVPRNTAFPYILNFAVAHIDTTGGDEIRIVEVRGTKPAFERGGMYLVRGTYALSTATNANLGFHLTATRPGDGCTQGNGRDAQAITNGRGEFALAMRFTYVGRPHVSIYANGRSHGGVYFGSGEFTGSDHHDLDMHRSTTVDAPPQGLQNFVSRLGHNELWMVARGLYRLDFEHAVTEFVPTTTEYRTHGATIEVPWTPEQINILPNHDLLVLDDFAARTVRFFDPNSRTVRRTVVLPQ